MVLFLGQKGVFSTKHYKYIREMLFMEYSPLVSVITIVYNGEKYLENTIQNIANQTYKNIEYIVVDGGSTDNTLAIIRQNQQNIALWISEKDNGISDAFNKGLKRAKGEIIGIINADDWYEKDAIEQVVKNIHDNDIVYGDLQLWRNEEKDFIVKGNHKYLEHEMTINHPTVFVKRECYEKYGLFDETYKCAMDYDVMLRFKVNQCRFKYLPDVLANMRWEGFSDTRWLLGCRETLAIKNKYLSHKKPLNYLYFIKHIMGIGIPKLLKKIRLDVVTRIYRSKFSKIKKVYK